jgi:DNA sulfur modification protein DndD
MLLKKIKLHNFRQFIDTQEIIFSSGNKNITIIFGENGKGKTGIFRAMMFGLFGDKYISQDNKSEKIHLVNLNKIEENNGRPTEMFVEIEFEEKESNYRIKRSMKAYKHNENIIESDSDASLEEYSRVTGTTSYYENEEQIKAIINRVLEQNIREFFFFDAEKIDTLSSTQAKVKGVVKQGIIKILQIDLFEEGIRTLSKSIKNLNDIVIRNSRNIDLRNKIASLESVEKSKSEQITAIELEEANLNKAKTEYSSICEKLNENHEIKAISESIIQKQELLRSKFEVINEIQRSIASNSFKEFHAMLLKQEFSTLNENLSLKLKDSISFIPKHLLEMTLEKETCFLCKSDISHNHDIKELIERMIQTKQSSDLNTFLLLMANTMSDFDLDSDKKKNELHQRILEIDEKRNEIVEIQRNIRDLETSIESIAAKEMNFAELEKSKQKYEADIEKYKGSLLIHEVTLKTNIDQIEAIEREIVSLRKKEVAIENERKKLEYLEAMKKILENLSNEYCDEMRYQLMEETTNITKMLIAREDKNIIDKIKINEKYEIEVYGWQGNRITQDISQGQRQMVSLAFISALAKLAAGSSSKIDFPLFMDTPFGRVSGENRDNLIKGMPDFTSQWILLFTDTELTTTEENVFKEQGKLGRSYRLHQVTEGVTKIKEIASHEQLATRGL